MARPSRKGHTPTTSHAGAIACLVAALLAGAPWHGSAPAAAATERAIAKERAAGAAAPIVVTARPVALNYADPNLVRAGRLTFLGGLALTSPDRRFGGISALLLAPDCRRFEAVSDHGDRFEGELGYGADGRLAGVAGVRVARLNGLDGRPLADDGGRDAESLARTASGDVIVGFEGRHRLWRYRSWRRPPVALAMPAGIAQIPGNGGIEALTVLRDGRLLAISEDGPADGGVRGWIGETRGRWSGLTLETGGGFRPTAAATLPDGRIVVLERRVLPPAARLRLIATAGVVAGARLVGEEIARLDGAFTVDNMEALDACRGADGATRLLIASDDNFNAFQRTLFLLFELPD